MAPSSSTPTVALLCCLLAGARGQDTQAPAAFDFAARRATHWAWQPLANARPPALPEPAAAGWRGPRGGPCDPVDRFVLARLQQRGLGPSPPAPPEVLLRRLWFDLVGLPPQPAAVARFCADPSDEAYDREVDELLASPHFGERWARHWLDLVRYAETLGHEFDFPLPNAWRYRDYVIRALNGDVPFNQFVREHIAGDLLANPRLDARGDDESVQATAAWWFVEQAHSPVDARQHQANRIDNQIDVLGKAVLGLTIACARCHDHKFDAIRTADYYGLVGIVESSRYVQAPIHAVDVRGADYARALHAQRDLARAWARAAAASDARWQPFADLEPAAWRSRAGWCAREADRIVASADGPRGDWIVTNDGFGDAPWCGPWCPDPAAEAPELCLLPGPFWHSGVAGIRREGVLQTRTFVLDERYVHVRAAGRHGRIQIVVDGLNLVRDPIYGELHRDVDAADAAWLTFDTAAWRGRRAHVQCTDQRARDLAHTDEGPAPDDAWIAVQAVLLSPHATPPPVAPRTAPPQPAWPALPGAVRAALAAVQASAARLPVSPTVPSLGDAPGSDEHVFVRGDPRQPGALAPRRFLEALAGPAPLATGPGSGRLALAAAVLADDDPLPARVFVNRCWHHLFGRGLVRSVDNFGALGDAPSHPELLDWLARDFEANGWSCKHVLRRLVRTRTYRQDSRECSAAHDVDPDNVLLHRQNVRRLEAEAVRDSLLAVAGRLDPTLFGPPVPIPLDEQPHARGKPKQSGPLDGDGRRSIYLAVQRNFLSPMLLAFDMPAPFATVGARNVSNVPDQALALANDPFVQAMCSRFAERVRDSANDLAGRLALAYTIAFARAPSPDEAACCERFLDDAAAMHGTRPADHAPWADLLHALVNTSEFTFLR
ncbi:MAG TPA: DUF1549 and DUF1553 domain-containing protein [Planctomycetota bacterium]|nr:DUF1549 and DUF1553 domain-containing protein [Planctomycetota bacterium]